MSQSLDMLPVFFSSPLSRRINFPAWQVHTSSILKRLQEIEWDSSIHGFQKLQDIKWHDLIHDSNINIVIEDDIALPVYYRTYSRRGKLKAENSWCEVAGHTLFTSLIPFQVEKFSFWEALPDKSLFQRRRKNELIAENSCGTKSGNCSSYLVGNPYWRPDRLTKPICFVVDNANWLIRLALLSTPLVPALCMGSKKLRQAV